MQLPNNRRTGYLRETLDYFEFSRSFRARSWAATANACRSSNLAAAAPDT
jgi:hypothetical protein